MFKFGKIEYFTDKNRLFQEPNLKSGGAIQNMMIQSKKKKIGILTFHRAHNYGAFLQCFALQSFLRDYGYETYVIDYNKRELWHSYEWFKIEELAFVFQKVRKIPSRAYRLLRSWLHRIPRYVCFRYFQDIILPLVPVESITNNPFDLILIGSDQVWNLDITAGFDEYYWGMFHRPTFTKVATYAASLKSVWSEENRDKALSILSSLDAVSVREIDIADLLKKSRRVQPVVLSDPVFLLKPEQWISLARKPHIHKPYILFYQAMNSQPILEMAQSIASKLNKKLVILSADVNGPNSNCSRNASPMDFLGWILYADMVLTSSFHATAFSMIFKKNFYSINLNMGQDSRACNILNYFGYADRYISNINDMKNLPLHSIDADLGACQKQALQFIETLLPL